MAGARQRRHRAATGRRPPRLRPRPDRARRRTRGRPPPLHARGRRARPLHRAGQRQPLGRALCRHADPHHGRRLRPCAGRPRPRRDRRIRGRAESAGVARHRRHLAVAAVRLPVGHLCHPPRHRDGRRWPDAAPRLRPLVAGRHARRLGRLRPAHRRAGPCHGPGPCRIRPLRPHRPPRSGGLRREFALWDEIAVWKQIHLHTGDTA
jgi:hypothetical protein